MSPTNSLRFFEGWCLGGRKTRDRWGLVWLGVCNALALGSWSRRARKPNPQRLHMTLSTDQADPHPRLPESAYWLLSVYIGFTRMPWSHVKFPFDATITATGHARSRGVLDFES